MTKISISTAADLLAAIPALLGFTPEHSLVALGLIANTVGPVVRVDIDGFDRTTAHHIADALGANGCDVTILVAVTDDDTRLRAALHHLDTLETVLVDAADIHTAAKIRTVALTAGARYIDLDTKAAGTVADPTESAAAAARVHAGLAIESTRAAITDRFELAAEVPAALGFAAAAHLGDVFLSATLEELAATLHAGEVPPDELCARTGIALTGGRPDVRDSFLRLPIYGELQAAQLMTHIANRLRGTARAQALTIAGFAYYLSGDGASAGDAFQFAIDTATGAGDKPLGLTTLLDTALRRGLNPTHLRELITTAQAVQDATGAHLPD